GPVFELYQNSPNPFQEMTLISFNLPQASEATVTIRDAAGQLIRVIKGDYAAGYNTIQVTKSMLQGASGVLNYTLETSEHKATRQMIVVQ
ncbi:MAG: T9SS type A sorting domain-containing protein, partial [Bacteroidota bacterium]